jgi:hypothetical protein
MIGFGSHQLGVVAIRYNACLVFFGERKRRSDWKGSMRKPFDVFLVILSLMGNCRRAINLWAIRLQIQWIHCAVSPIEPIYTVAPPHVEQPVAACTPPSP